MEEIKRYNKKHFVNKEKIENKIEELEDYIQENSDEQGYWGEKSQEEIYAKIEVLQELLEESEE